MPNGTPSTLPLRGWWTTFSKNTFINSLPGYYPRHDERENSVLCGKLRSSSSLFRKPTTSFRSLFERYPPLLSPPPSSSPLLSSCFFISTLASLRPLRRLLPFPPTFPLAEDPPLPYRILLTRALPRREDRDRRVVSPRSRSPLLILACVRVCIVSSQSISLNLKGRRRRRILFGRGQTLQLCLISELDISH